VLGILFDNQVYKRLQLNYSPGVKYDTIQQEFYLSQFYWFNKVDFSRDAVTVGPAAAVQWLLPVIIAVASMINFVSLSSHGYTISRLRQPIVQSKEQSTHCWLNQVLR